MKRTLIAVALLVGYLACTSSASAYEHKLQFTPYIPYNPVWGNSLVVIGEQFTLDANNQINGVTGLIHFVTVPSGCRYICPHTNRDWTGTWDLNGNLLGTTQVAWVPQPSIGSAVSSTPVAGIAETIYAQGVLLNGNAITTGADAYRRGYVDTVQSHFIWPVNSGGFPVTSPQENTPGYFVISRTPPFVFSVTLTSDGDLPLNITSTVSTVSVSGTYTNGTATTTYLPQAGDCLAGSVAPGTSCSIQISFDPSTIVSTSSPYGYAYNNYSLGLASDAGNLPDFRASFTITGFTPPDE